MKSFIKIFIVTIAFLSLIPLAAQGMGKGGPGKKGPGREMKGMMSEKMLEEAGVPEAKRAEIRKKQHEIHKEMMDINYNIGELRIKMKNEFEKEKTDIATLKNLNGQIAELRKKQFTLMGNFKIDLISSLTLDQRKKMMEIMKEKRKKFMEKMGDDDADDMDD